MTRFATLCAIQIEVEENAEKLSEDINFNCGRSIDDLFENLTMPNQPMKPVRSQSLRERTKGNRKMSDITVQTFTDFESRAATSSKSSKGMPMISMSQSIYFFNLLPGLQNQQFGTIFVMIELKDSFRNVFFGNSCPNIVNFPTMQICLSG